MSTSTTQNGEETLRPGEARTDSRSSNQDVAEEFTLWVLASLKLKPREEGRGMYGVEIPADRQEQIGIGERLRFVCTSARHAVLSADQQREVEVIAPGSRLFNRLLERLCALQPSIHAVPDSQPASVHELAPRLLGAYSFPSGRIRLGGCMLEDRPFVRLTFANRRQADGSPRLHHEYAWPDGRPVDPTLIQGLGLDHLAPHTGRQPRVSEAEIEGWMRSARDRHATETEASDPPLVECLVWCKYAEGKIVFFHRERSVEVPFGGWARFLADGSDLPPPFRCPVSERESYDLATTDDGQITVAEAILACEVSGKRVIETELRTCAVTGRRVLEEYLASCAVTDERVLADELIPCGMCHQRVSPSAMENERCAACRGLQRVNKDDARLARVLGEYPGLDRWPRWRISETSRTYVLLGRTLWRQILVVVDQHTLEPRRLATASRILPCWTEVSDAQIGRHLH